MEIYNRVATIAEDVSKQPKERIDDLLRLDKEYHSSLGKNSTKQEKKEVYANSRIIYKAIKGLDEKLGDLFLRASD